MESNKQVKAILEIGLPESCWKCNCAYFGGITEKLICGAMRTAEYVHDHIDSRASFCPLRYRLPFNTLQFSEVAQ